MRVRRSNAGWLASLPEPARKTLTAALSPAAAHALLYDWPFWARPAQLPPQGDWRVWLLLAGPRIWQDPNRRRADPRQSGSADGAPGGARCANCR
jgi:hypothetical protein